MQSAINKSDSYMPRTSFTDVGSWRQSLVITLCFALVWGVIVLASVGLSDKEFRYTHSPNGECVFYCAKIHIVFTHSILDNGWKPTT
jgi:hypothetical protein